MKKFTKLLGIVLIIALVMSMGITAAFADGEGSLTVKNSEVGTTYNFYRILDLTGQDTAEDEETVLYNAVVYKLNSKWTAFWTTGAGKDYIVAENSGNLATINVDGVIKYINITDSNKVAFTNAAMKYAIDNSIATDKTASGATADVSVTGLDLGYYLMIPVDATDEKENPLTTGTIASLTSTIPSADIYVKATKPSIEKTDDVVSADVGQTVTYTVTGKMPNTSGTTSYTYKISDTMTAGLTFNKDVVVKIDGVTNPITSQCTIDYTTDTQGFTCTIPVAELQGENGANIKMNMEEASVLTLKSGVNGESAFGLEFNSADDSSIVNIDSDIKKADVVLDGPMMKVSDESTNFAGVNSFNAKKGTLDLQNDQVRQLIANSFTVSGALNLMLDVDLANKVMDTLGSLDVTPEGNINVSSMKLLSDAQDKTTLIDFAEENYKNSVTSSVASISSAKYDYQVAYNLDTGQFEFVRGGKKDPEENSANLAAAHALAGAQFIHDSINMQVLERDVYSLVGLSAGDDFGISPWVKTFGSDDSVELNNTSDKIKAQFFGVIGGFDSKRFVYDNDAEARYGVYAAYAGSKQKHHSSKIKQEGGYVGVSAVVNTDYAFAHLTANAGYLYNRPNTEWGKDRFNTKVGSVAAKTGVIFYLGDTKIIPAIHVAYMAIKSDDYTNAAGYRVKQDLLNVIEVKPELRIAQDFCMGLSGFIKAAYVKNFNEGGDINVDSVLMKDMSAKPYFEYGIGFEKDWSQEEWNPVDLNTFATITRRDGGREGWDGNLGMKYDF